METTTAAIAALKKGNYPAALRLLLKGWKQAPDLALGTLIAQVSERAKPASSPLAQSSASLNQAWDALANKRDPSTVPWLLAHLRRGYEPHLGRVTALAKFPADPRLGAVAVEWLDPHRLRHRAGLFAPFAALLAASRDPRAIEVLSVLRDDARNAKRHTLAGLATAALANLPRPPKGKVSPAELARLQAALDGAQKRSKPSAPFDAVYADPGSDAARLAAATALQKAGDPRGELIRLQLDPKKKDGKRATQLIERLRDGWLAEWEDFAGSVEFSRGFPVFALLFRAPPRRIPALRTLERVTIDGPDAGFLAAPELASVRWACLSAPALLSALAKGPLPCRTLKVSQGTDEATAQIIRACGDGRLPMLERLESEGSVASPDFGPRAAGALAALPRAKEIAWHFTHASGGDVIASTLPRAVREGWELALGVPRMKTTLEKGSLRLKVDGRLTVDTFEPLDVHEELVRGLVTLPARSLARLELEIGHPVALLPASPPPPFDRLAPLAQVFDYQR